MTVKPADAARDALIALMAEQNTALAARVPEVESANAELTARVRRLERGVAELWQFVSPPSLDDQPQRPHPLPTWPKRAEEGTVSSPRYARRTKAKG